MILGISLVLVVAISVYYIAISVFGIFGCNFFPRLDYGPMLALLPKDDGQLSLFVHWRLQKVSKVPNFMMEIRLAHQLKSLILVLVIILYKLKLKILLTFCKHPNNLKESHH